MLKTILRYLIAFVWLVNGLFYKVLNLMPRHELIVAQILGKEYSNYLIVMIGLSEVGMVAWVLSKWKSTWCTWTQIFIVLLMNVLEFLLVPDLLMFGRYNLLVAIVFCIIIYIQEFKLKEHAARA